MDIGFSTGSIALNDFQIAINMLKESKANAIELSALREWELEPLINSIPQLNLTQFHYISFHAPSAISSYSEKEFIDQLLKVKEFGYPIIVHPDILVDFGLWRTLGSSLVIENMDKRKPVGRTTQDLEFIFSRLPDAKFCFDLAHAQQVDPTMTEAIKLVHTFKDRMVQLHVSYVNSKSAHERLNLEALLAFNKVVPLLPVDLPVILEAMIPGDYLNNEIDIASILFESKLFIPFIEKYGLVMDANTHFIRRKEIYQSTS